MAFPPDPQEGGGRELLPTENSHFFAARFRNTPGLMPFSELCNQGHRSRAKQTRLCVCSRGPGEAHRGREGLRPGLGVGLGGSENAAGGSGAGAPSHRGPRPIAGPRAGQLGPSGSAPPPPRPPPPPGDELGPKSRRTSVTARGQIDLGLEGGAGKCWTPVPAPFQLGTPRSSSPPLSPRPWGGCAPSCGKVTTPPPNSGGRPTRVTRASSATPQSLRTGGGGAGQGDSCAMTPLPLARQEPGPRAAPMGV